MRLALVKKQEEAPGVISFFFRPPEPLAWRAGQYLIYTLPHKNPDARGTRRFYTIASAPHEQLVRVTTRFAPEKGSSFKRALSELPLGDTIEARGPLGPFVIDDPAAAYVFIAGGIGITPFRSILLDLEHRGLPLNITLLYGNRTNDIVFKNELDRLAAEHPEFRARYLVDPERIDEAAIRAASPDLSRPFFYVSGPEPMVKASEELLRSMGIPEEHIRHDYFPGYATF